MQLKVIQGDIAHTRADVLVASANPWLRLTGGVGAALEAVAGDSLRGELEAHLRASGLAMVAPGTVVRTGPAGHFQAVFHAVAIDGRYHSSPELIRASLLEVFAQARQGGFRSLALPALATGYGNLPMIDFLLVLRELLPECGLEELVLVLSRAEFVEQAGIVLETHLPASGPEPPAAPEWRLLLMVETLHSWGYEQVRIYPHLSPSGVWWRCYFSPASNLKADGSGLLKIPEMKGGQGLTARYSHSEKDMFFGWPEAQAFNAFQLATRLLASFPVLAQASRQPDPAYVRWYREQVLRRCSPDNLPFVGYDENYECLGYINRNNEKLEAPPPPLVAHP